MISKLMWLGLFVISGVAIGVNWSEDLWRLRNSYSYGKYVLWAAYFAFVGYGLYATKRENFFKSVKKIASLYWGRQVGIDLYIGFVLFLAFIGFHQSSLTAVALWTVPMLIYGNQLSLLYLAIHYESFMPK